MCDKYEFIELEFKELDVKAKDFQFFDKEVFRVDMVKNFLIKLDYKESKLQDLKPGDINITVPLDFIKKFSPNYLTDNRFFFHNGLFCLFYYALS